MAHLIDWGSEVLQVLGAASVVAIAVWLALALRRSRGLPRRRALASSAVDVALVLSLVAIGVAGLRPGIGLPGGFEQWNLVPFRDLARALDGRPWGLGPAVAGILGNLILFVPMGFLFALRFRHRTWRTLLVLTFAISVGVEMWQAVTATGRSSDVTDIVVNTAGGLIGYGLGRAAGGLSVRPQSVSPAPAPGRDP